MIQSIFVTFIRIHAPVEQVECGLQLLSSILGALAAQHLVDAMRIFVERMNGALGRRWALSPHSLGLVANRRAAGRLVPPAPFSWVGARRSGLHLHKTAPVNVAPTLGATFPRPRGLDWGRTGLPDADRGSESRRGTNSRAREDGAVVPGCAQGAPSRPG